jgi:hypothetical protein
MYRIELSLRRNVNHFWQYFLIQVLAKDMKELREVLNSSFLFQSAINHSSHSQSFCESHVVYPCFPWKDSGFLGLSKPMIDEVVASHGVQHFVRGSEDILFEINLHSSAIASEIQGYSKCPDESEVLAAELLQFVVIAVESADSTEFTMPEMKLKCFVSGFAFDIQSDE